MLANPNPARTYAVSLSTLVPFQRRAGRGRHSSVRPLLDSGWTENGADAESQKWIFDFSVAISRWDARGRGFHRSFEVALLKGTAYRPGRRPRPLAQCRCGCGAGEGCRTLQSSGTGPRCDRASGQPGHGRVQHNARLESQQAAGGRATSVTQVGADAGIRRHARCRSGQCGRRLGEVYSSMRWRSTARRSPAAARPSTMRRHWLNVVVSGMVVSRSSVSQWVTHQQWLAKTS